MTASDQNKHPGQSADKITQNRANSVYVPGIIVLGQAGEGAGLSPTHIGIIIGVIVVLILLYAIVRALSRPKKPEITERREVTPEDRVPTKDVLENRMEVEGPVEITDDMSLADIKRAKAARVTSKSKAVRRETSKEATERAQRERAAAQEAAKAAEESAEAAKEDATDAADAAKDAADDAAQAAQAAQQAEDAAKKAAEAAAKKIESTLKEEAESSADSVDSPTTQIEDESQAEKPKKSLLPAPNLQLKKPEIAPSLDDSEAIEDKPRPSFKLPKPRPKDLVEEGVVEEDVRADEDKLAGEGVQAPVLDESIVEEPVVEESVVEEPVVEEPVVEEPVVEEPVVEEPVVDEPVVDEPIVEEPVLEEPVIKAPATTDEPAPKSLAQGLAKTRTGFIGRLSGLFSGEQLADDMVDEVEEILFTADIGPRVAQGILNAVEEGLSGEEMQDPARIWGFIREYSADLLKSHEKPLDLERAKPFVMLVVGVNGAGKTTTIGKLASKYRADGKKVLLVAGDTFRAGAVDQLAVWADRTGIPIHEGADEADPSSVLFAGIERGLKEDMDVIICDTSGRLQTNVNLMDELAKMARVAGKALDGAPHETMLVLDANTGQNAIIQAKKFNEAVKITGIALTKLDGTARGGVILGICDELDAPVRYIGIGESVEDLRVFDADEFVDALFM